MIQDFLSRDLEDRKKNNSYRVLKVQKDLIDFCSNDYLGFARSNILKNKILSEIEQLNGYNLGSTGSRLLTGNNTFIEETEKFLAEFHKAESGLIFNSGYDANLGLFSTIPKKGDTILFDELIHASIRDGIRLSSAESYSFRHNDAVDIKKKLKSSTGNVFISVESIYSMDGDEAPLEELVELCEGKNRNLIVDEAHATGIFGENGEGKVVEYHLQNKVFARLHTFGKAMGCHGAIMVGSITLKEYLVNFCRPFIYTTALPPHSIISIKCAYEYLQSSIKTINNLKKLIEYFRDLISSDSTLKITESHSPIQCIIIPGNNNVKKAESYVQKNGYDVRAILYPTVKKGKERLRICLHAFNTEKEIVEMVGLLKNYSN